MPKFFVVLAGAPARDKQVPASAPAILLKALEPHGITADSLVSVRACGGSGAYRFGRAACPGARRSGVAHWHTISI